MLSVAQVAEELGISEGLVYGWCQSGRLPHLRLGGKRKRGCIRITQADLDAFLATCRREAPPVEPSPMPRGKAPRDDSFSAYYERVMNEVQAKAGRRKHR